MPTPTSVTVQRNGFAHWTASWRPPLKPGQWASVQWSVVGVTRGSALRRAARTIRQQERNAATVETVEVTTR